MQTTQFGSLREKIAFESAQRKADYVTYAAVVERAYAAGAKAAEAVTPVPMTVTDTGSLQQWHVAEGVCGFGWVTVTPGTSRFARWLTKCMKAQKAYRGGVSLWSPLRTQSLARNEAWADAFATVLRNELGVTAYGHSRID
jgi:hypothetical protein